MRVLQIKVPPLQRVAASYSALDAQLTETRGELAQVRAFGVL